MPDAPRPAAARAAPSASSAAASSAACWRWPPPGSGMKTHIYCPDPESPAFDVTPLQDRRRLRRRGGAGRVRRRRRRRDLRVRERAGRDRRIPRRLKPLRPGAQGAGRGAGPAGREGLPRRSTACRSRPIAAVADRRRPRGGARRARHCRPCSRPRGSATTARASASSATRDGRRSSPASCCRPSRWCSRPSCRSSGDLGGRRPRPRRRGRRLRSGRERPPRPHPRDQHRARRRSAPTTAAKRVADRRAIVDGARLCRRARGRVLRRSRGGKLLVNEIAPRVHNSGHWTEAVCDHRPVRAAHPRHLRLAARRPDAPRRRGDGEPDRRRDRRHPPAARRPAPGRMLYGKAEARPGRKMGHINRIARKNAAK